MYYHEWMHHAADDWLVFWFINKLLAPRLFLLESPRPTIRAGETLALFFILLLVWNTDSVKEFGGCMMPSRSSCRALLAFVDSDVTRALTFE
jgi:hypothetical protein